MAHVGGTITSRSLNSKAFLTLILLDFLVTLFFFLINVFILFYLIYLFRLRWVFVAARGFFSGCGELLFVAVRGLLIAVASLVVEHGL